MICLYRSVYGHFETISYLLMLVIFPGNNSVVRHTIRYAHNISWHTNSPKSPNKSKFSDFIDINHIITNHSHFLYIPDVGIRHFVAKHGDIVYIAN